MTEAKAVRSFTSRQVGDLAGNAFTGQIGGMVFLAALITFPAGSVVSLSADPVFSAALVDTFDDDCSDDSGNVAVSDDSDSDESSGGSALSGRA